MGTTSSSAKALKPARQQKERCVPFPVQTEAPRQDFLSSIQVVLHRISTGLYIFGAVSEWTILLYAWALEGASVTNLVVLAFIAFLFGVVGIVAGTLIGMVSDTIAKELEGGRHYGRS